MKRFLLAFGSVLLLAVGVVLVRTLRYQPAEAPVQPVPDVAVPAGASERLARAVRIPSISHGDPDAFDAGAFRALHSYLAAHFPRVHAQARRETVGAHSLLYTWQGTDPPLKPILLIGHLDVGTRRAGYGG